MITKKEITFFAIAAAAISIMSFGFNSILPENKGTSYSVQQKADVETTSFKQSYSNTKTKSLTRRNKDISSIKNFRNQLKNKKFTFDDFKVSKNKRKAPKTQKSQKTTKKKVAKKDTKKKKEKKKKVAKKGKNRKLRPYKIAEALEPTEPLDGIETADFSSKNVKINNQLTSRQNPPSQSDDTENLETEEDSSSITIGATTAAVDNTVEAQNIENNENSVYSDLLASGSFLEFEQLLQTNLSEEERLKSYTAALKFLFEQTEDNFQGIDTFIMAQFKNHRHAIVVSKSLADSSLDSNQLIYSVELLTDLIGSWNIEQGSDQFRTIYQERVAENIPTTNGNQELFSSLQTSIDLKLVSLTDSNVEVSLN